MSRRLRRVNSRVFFLLSDGLFTRAGGSGQTAAMPTDQLQFDLSATQVENPAIEQLQRELRFVAETVTTILDNLPVQRRPLSESTRALHVRVTWERRNGLCPCCQTVPVCTAEGKLPGAEHDHWYSRHRNRAEETWLVCGDCNRRLESTPFKGSVRSAFEAYQLALRPFLDDAQPGMWATTSA